MNCMKVITEYRVYQNLNLLGVKLFLTPLLLQCGIKFATHLFVCQSLFLSRQKSCTLSKTIRLRVFNLLTRQLQFEQVPYSYTPSE